ncbi:MAG: response regulator transcription factor [Clostridia bacterium]|nr:response regulator transcription factor [Clostridia bacterium]
MARILVVEDEVMINELIVENLKLVGHKCISAFDGEKALEIINSNLLDLIILDVMLPKRSGFDIIKEISNVPVIFLTAKSDLSDRLKGLSLGADDYILKPFEMPELLARVKVILRRTKRDEMFFPIDDKLIDFEQRKVFKDGVEVDLTPKEFDILDALVTNRNIILTREQLISLVWSFDYEGDTNRIIDVYIRQLKKKLELQNRIRSIYGVGYRLEL